MGYYINPKNMTKEEWLEKYCTQSNCNITSWDDIFSTEELPVCLVDNGAFKAAGIAYSKNEFEAFKYPDGRLKIWYIVPLGKLKEFLPNDTE